MCAEATSESMSSISQLTIQISHVMTLSLRHLKQTYSIVVRVHLISFTNCMTNMSIYPAEHIKLARTRELYVYYLLS